MSGFIHQQPAPAQTFTIEEAEQSVAPWFSIPYEEQLERKSQMLREVLGRPLSSFIQPILPSPKTVGHRNKMEFSFGYDDDERPALGFHQRKKFWRVADLDRSAFLSEASNQAYAEIKRWALQTGLPFYRQIDNRGFFRYLVIREGKRTGEVLVNLVVNPAGFEGGISKVRSQLVALAERGSVVTSLWLSYRQSVGDAAAGEKSELLAGIPIIREKVLDLTFHISPVSFFQVNSFGAEMLYGKLRELVAEMPDRQTLVDLYCGSGGIALALSRQFKRVWGVDSDGESIRLAIENARINQIDHVTFVGAQAKQIREIISGPIDVLLVDPPRAGLAPKVVRNVLRLAPKRLIYISCDPQTFCENMHALQQQFQVEGILPVDLFPHTPHIELIVSLVSSSR